ncbi:SH3 domain-containing protein [Phaeobacter sp. CAU 1743]|uniref:SH3 domain-containing protein n=1 Tax=Phaeobacter sp. CAU 1743 TaxID=3140367 RepID=UPI00325BC1AF
MSRFVLASFAFLGWGFYELSGGADFTPPQRPVVEKSAATDPADSPAKPATTRNEITVTASSLVTRTSLDQRHKALAQARAAGQQGLSPNLSPNQGAQEAAAKDGTAASSATSPRETDSSPGTPPFVTSRTSAARVISAGLDTGGMELASLEEGLGGGMQLGLQGLGTTQTPLAAATNQPPAPGTALLAPGLTEDPATDKRSIRAARVNMRQGPGTAYPIITRLLAGDEVIVIGDSGTGWLHLRTPDNEHFGWIAASLVSQKAP